MLRMFKDFFAPADRSSLMAPEKDFERLMDRVEEDEMDLLRLENQVHEEFYGINEEVKSISKGVDRTVEKTAS